MTLVKAAGCVEARVPTFYAMFTSYLLIFELELMIKSDISYYISEFDSRQYPQI